MKRNLVPVLLLTVAMAVSGCASTKFTSTWKAPGANPVDPDPGSKIVAVVVEQDENRRRRHESYLARELSARGYEGVASFTLVPVGQLQDEAAAKAAFDGAGAVGVIVMRVVGIDVDRVERPSQYYSGPTYGGYWGGYYGYGWTTVYSPGYLREETTVAVETLIYDLEQNTLLWAGTSESTNPDNAPELIQNLVAMAANEMKKAGVLVR